MMMNLTLLLLLLLSLSEQILIIQDAEAVIPVLGTNKNCKQQCGRISIPYPFGIGIGSNCSLDERYAVICNESFNPPKPFLHTNAQNYLEVLAISLDDNTVTVRTPVFSNSVNCPMLKAREDPLSLDGTPFAFSDSVNSFVSVGCDSSAFLISDTNDNKERKKTVSGCMSFCPSSTEYDNNNKKTSPEERIGSPSSMCHGPGFCQAWIPWPLKALDVLFKKIKSVSGDGGNGPKQYCSYAFIAEKKWVNSSLEPSEFLGHINQRRPVDKYIPAVLEWSMDNFGPCFGDSQLLTNIIGFNNGSSTSVVYCGRNAHCSRTSSSNPSFGCSCDKGYQGNPYVECKDIDECANAKENPCGMHSVCTNTEGNYSCSCSFGHYYNGSCNYVRKIIVSVATSGGVILILGCLWRLYREYKKRKENKLKKQYFKRNGGLLLQQQLSSREDNVEKTKLFTSKELEKATDHYNENRILGRGGQGTVYKGMLTDGTIVAIKRSKLLDTSKVKQFINEVAILSKINHRNVVKILGCCLETEFPILVYEFIPNGTLYQYIHDENNEEFLFSWDMRLQIATEIAEALSYLHSSASTPIYHRDIKSTNILLDERFRAKVADFGISKSVLIDNTHVTTIVQGTFGYLDPEYFQTKKFTNKSDVYSFGVVLVELLTSLEPIFSVTHQEEEIGLASHFVLAMEQHCFFDIVDARIIEVARKGEIMAVANLARRCLNLDGKKRPTMKAVALELEGIRISREAFLSNRANKVLVNAAKPANWRNPSMMLQLGQSLSPWRS